MGHDPALAHQPARTPGILLRFLGMALAWGSSFLFMKVAVTGMSPGQVVLGRLVLGAAALGLVLTLTRRRLPRNPRLWAHVAVLAGFGCIIPFLLFAWAAERIPSGLSSVFNSATPLMTAAATLAVLRQETVGVRQVIALLTGAAGLVVVLSPWQFGTGEAIDMWGQLACLGATLSLGVIFAYTRKYVSPFSEEPAAVAAAQMLMAAAVLMLLIPFVAPGEVRLTGPVVLSMLALGIVSTGLAYIWSFEVIARWGATAASTVAYLTPLVGVVLGVVMLHESLSWTQVAGGAVVVLSMMLGQRRTPGPGG